MGDAKLKLNGTGGSKLAKRKRMPLACNGRDCHVGPRPRQVGQDDENQKTRRLSVMAVRG